MSTEDLQDLTLEEFAALSDAFYNEYDSDCSDESDTNSTLEDEPENDVDEEEENEFANITTATLYSFDPVGPPPSQNSNSHEEQQEQNFNQVLSSRLDNTDWWVQKWLKYF